MFPLSQVLQTELLQIMQFNKDDGFVLYLWSGKYDDQIETIQ